MQGQGQVQWKECCGELQTINATPRRPHLLEKKTLLEKVSLLRKMTTLLGDGGWWMVGAGAGVQQHIVADEMIPGELK